ncbi:hypothetical protein PoB_000883500 [Plakobranchus ocellatus]|uniref:Uncharacterized protein n=1 Tax=Plakobranchus ocellatus TaxID=259542 RepID=A0AAV3YII7_9GAST|nr:hypothetical protein PoB_000883500 [Plakobranchus ocellatus]
MAFPQHKHWSIPQGVDGWTIHGLWPSIRGSEKLTNCNNSMKFHFNEIEVLSKILAVKWPDYCTDEDKRRLCVLSDYGVVPSKKQKYTVGEIFNALKKGYGKIPDITCIYDVENHTFHLEQIRLCFNKQLKMMDCPGVTYPKSTGTSTLHFESIKQQDPSIFIRSNFEDCPHHHKVYYYPIPRKY